MGGDGSVSVPPVADPTVPGAFPFDVNETDRLLSTTRAVRKRLDLDRPVDPALIHDCIRLAVQAPTGSNEQTWRWMVVTDQAKRTAIAEAYNAVGKAYLEQAGNSVEDEQTRRVYESALALTGILERVPVHVIPCIERRFEGAPNGVAASAYGSIMPAAWSFLLALRSRGLGSVWTTLHLFKEAEVAELLGIPDNVTQVALFPVAHTVGTEFKPATRPPVETITYWDAWGDSR
jgi:nitroreductase